MLSLSKDFQKWGMGAPELGGTPDLRLLGPQGGVELAGDPASLRVSLQV